METNRSPFLTARWINLALVTYEVPHALLKPLLPPLCDLDLFEGKALVSLVAFEFRDTRVWGISWPGFRNFPEINLRFYVRHNGQRGVTFVREYVAHRIVANIARIFYNEPYRVAAMTSTAEKKDMTIAVEHSVQVAGAHHSIRIVGDVNPTLPAAGTIEHFIKEQEWGFGRSRAGSLLRYRVDHPRWEIHAVQSLALKWDWSAIYGKRWQFLQNQKPLSVMLAGGSAVQVLPNSALPAPIVLYDGVCALCNGAVNFIIDHDPSGVFQFTALQSDVGRQLLIDHRMNPDKLDSIVLVENGRAYTRSTAALRIARKMRMPFQALAAFVAIPAPLRDAIYNWIARNRYRWFGKYDSCRMPRPEWAGRFLSE